MIGAPAVAPRSRWVGVRIIAGWNIGHVPETREMPDRCTEHGVAAPVETVTVEDVRASGVGVVTRSSEVVVGAGTIDGSTSVPTGLK